MNEPLHIGPFRLLERIGKGGMAQVWRGQWIGPGGLVMPVAVKLILPDLAANAKCTRMFLGEARISMKLSHANICRVYPMMGTEDSPYIAMEWVNGRNLAELSERLRMSRRELSYEVIEYMIYSLLRALDAAHTFRQGGKPQPVIHRDVSPQNVMISVRGEVKLMDFGIARVLVDQTSPIEYAGKLRYSPIEQLEGKIVPATDLYAVGAVLHEMVEGCLFRGDCLSREDMVACIQRGDVPLLTRPKVPATLRDLHRALLQPNPADRPQSAEDALELLGSVTVQQSKLAALVAADLGERAGVSGSTLGDFVVPPQVAAVPDPQPIHEAEDAEGDASGEVEHGALVQRANTVRLRPPSDGGAPSPPKVGPLEFGGAVPRRRARPRGEWIRLRLESTTPPPSAPPASVNDEEGAPRSTAARSASDRLESTDVDPPVAASPSRRTTAVEQASEPRKPRMVARWVGIGAGVVAAPLVGAAIYVALGGHLEAPGDQSEEHSAVQHGLDNGAILDHAIGGELQLNEGGEWRELPSGHTTLQPGHYSLRWRAHEDGPWQRRAFVVSLGERYELVLDGGEFRVLPPTGRRP